MLRALALAIPDGGSQTFFGDIAQQIYRRAPQGAAPVRASPHGGALCTTVAHGPLPVNVAYAAPRSACHLAGPAIGEEDGWAGEPFVARLSRKGGLSGGFN
jgi:hypothetical protein